MTPMCTVTFRRRYVKIALALAVSFGAWFINPAAQAQAAIITWDGGGADGTCGGAAGDGNKWSCGLNWSGDVAPGTADVAGGMT